MRAGQYFCNRLSVRLTLSVTLSVHTLSTLRCLSLQHHLQRDFIAAAPLVSGLLCPQVKQMFESLSEQDRQLQIQIGLDTLGDGSNFVARSISSFNPANQTVQVSTCARTPGAAAPHACADLGLGFVTCAEHIPPIFCSAFESSASFAWITLMADYACWGRHTSLGSTMPPIACWSKLPTLVWPLPCIVLSMLLRDCLSLSGAASNITWASV